MSALTVAAAGLAAVDLVVAAAGLAADFSSLASAIAFANAAVFGAAVALDEGEVSGLVEAEPLFFSASACFLDAKWALTRPAVNVWSHAEHHQFVLGASLEVDMSV